MRTLTLLLLAGAATAQAPSYKPQPYGNLKQVMRSILLPNSDAIFNVARTPPKNDMEWAAIENSAIAIQEAANLITMPGRKRSDGTPVPVQRDDWIKYAQGLVAAGQAAYKAAQSKNPETVDNSTDQLSDACQHCHEVYRDRPQGKQ